MFPGQQNTSKGQQNSARGQIGQSYGARATRSSTSEFGIRNMGEMVSMDDNRVYRVNQNLNFVQEVPVQDNSSKPTSLHNIEYSTSDILGVGSFYKAYRGHFRGYKDVTVKIASTRNGGKKLLENEINKTTLLDKCLHVRRLYQVEVSPSKDLYYLAFEGLGKRLQGDLTVVHHSNYKPALFEQSLQGFKYLHDQSILHRDVRAKNFFVEESKYFSKSH